MQCLQWKVFTDLHPVCTCSRRHSTILKHTPVSHWWNYHFVGLDFSISTPHSYITETYTILKWLPITIYCTPCLVKILPFSLNKKKEKLRFSTLKIYVGIHGLSIRSPNSFYHCLKNIESRFTAFANCIHETSHLQRLSLKGRPLERDISAPPSRNTILNPICDKRKTNSCNACSEKVLYIHNLSAHVVRVTTPYRSTPLFVTDETITLWALIAQFPHPIVTSQKRVIH